MNKLNPQPAKKVIRRFRKIGYRKVHQRGSHLSMKNPDTGRIIVIPVHGKDIPIGTLRNIVVNPIISHPDIDYKRAAHTNNDIDAYIKDKKLKEFSGYFSKTEIIEHVLKNKVSRDDGIQTKGTNFIWFALFGFCTAHFFIKFYNHNQPPPTTIIYDKKSMDPELISGLHLFQEKQLNDFQKKFTGYDIDITLNEGDKRLSGIKVADKIVRSAHNNLKNCPIDLTEYFEMCVLERPKVFNYKM
jgi:predicted RNA binding protein YcfA (HicA-like mRNA interferase family)